MKTMQTSKTFINAQTLTKGSTFPLSVGTQNNKTKHSDVGVQRAELMSQAQCVYGVA